MDGLPVGVMIGDGDVLSAHADVCLMLSTSFAIYLLSQRRQPQTRQKITIILIDVKIKKCAFMCGGGCG